MFFTEEPINDNFFSGGSILIKHLAKQLKKKGKEPIIVANEKSNKKFNSIKVYNKLKFSKNLFLRFFYLLKNKEKIEKLVKKEDPDVLFVNTYGLFLPVFKVGEKFNKTKICHVGSFPGKGINSFLAKKLLKKPWDLIFSVGDKLTNYCKKITKTKVIDIGNAVDQNKFKKIGKSKARKKLNLPKNKEIILFVGRLTKVKRVDDLIEKFSGTYNKNKLLVIVGDGPQRKNLENLANKLNLESKVIFKGNLDYEKMPLVYNAADVFVLNSKTEGIPRTVLESLSCKTPVFLRKRAGKYFNKYKTDAIQFFKNKEEFRNNLQKLIKSNPKISGGLLKDFSWNEISEKLIYVINKKI